jgi:hypothetical protein
MGTDLILVLIVGIGKEAKLQDLRVLTDEQFTFLDKARMSEII